MNPYLRSMLIVGMFCIGAVSVGAAETPLKVQAFSEQSSTKSGMMFLVKGRVENSSDAPLRFQCHTCSYEKHWEVDTPGVFIQPWTCNEDAVESVVLKAGEAYERNIILYIPKTDESGPVTFRLGFKRAMGDESESDPVWSDPLTMDVFVPEGMVASQKLQEKESAVEISESMPDEIPEDEDPVASEDDPSEMDSQILKKIP